MAEISDTQAVMRLATAKQHHPALQRLEAAARVELARSILEMDEALEIGPAITEQAEVELAIRAYAEALADLVRGEAGSTTAAAGRTHAHEGAQL